MITEGDNSVETSGGRRTGNWRLCTVQQVEDLKSLLGVLPVWSAGITLSVSIGVMIGMIVLQALAMDRSIGDHFKIPAGSITVCTLVAFIAITPVLDRAVFPLWRRIAGAPPTALKRVGLGHVVNIAGMVAAALVERRRLGIVHELHGAEEAAGWRNLGKQEELKWAVKLVEQVASEIFRASRGWRMGVTRLTAG
ncbi:hypothetical protein ACQ4PT_032027 [Festuca glaucescens]